MFLTCIILFLVCIQDQVAGRCKTVEDTELMMAFLVHRHGDRTPESSELSYSDNPIELARRSQVYGFGNLTDIGKARSFILGQFFRRRYDQFLSSCYNPSEIFVRSTETNRTQMTVKIAVTAAYSSDVLWSDDLKLEPLEMTVVPLSEDPNFSLLNCREVSSHFMDLMTEDEFPKDLKKYDELMDILSKDLLVPLRKSSWDLYLKLNNFATQESLGMPLSDLNRRLLPTLRQAAGIAAKYVFGNQTYLPLQSGFQFFDDDWADLKKSSVWKNIISDGTIHSHHIDLYSLDLVSFTTNILYPGVLLKDFFDTADKIISGAKIPRLRVFSAHDFNVYSFVAATRAFPRQGAPRYCSVYSLELRQCRETGKYVVVPVYVTTPEQPETYLEIGNCGVICDYEKFRKVTAKNVMTEDQYRTRCQDSEEDED